MLCVFLLSVCYYCCKYLVLLQPDIILQQPTFFGATSISYNMYAMIITVINILDKNTGQPFSFLLSCLELSYLIILSILCLWSVHHTAYLQMPANVSRMTTNVILAYKHLPMFMIQYLPILAGNMMEHDLGFTQNIISVCDVGH